MDIFFSPAVHRIHSKADKRKSNHAPKGAKDGKSFVNYPGFLLPFFSPKDDLKKNWEECHQTELNSQKTSLREAKKKAQLVEATAACPAGLTAAMAKVLSCSPPGRAGTSKVPRGYQFGCNRGLPFFFVRFYFAC